MKRANIKPQSSRGASAEGVSYSSQAAQKALLPKWRSRFILLLILAALTALIGRAIWLQGVSTEFLQKKGESRYVRTLNLPATRGKIMDRNGHVLASSLPVKAIWAIPENVRKESTKKRYKLAKLLGMSQHTLNRKLDPKKRYVSLKRQVKPDIADAIVKLKIEGIQTSKAYKRYYPEGAEMAHVVGFTNIEDVGQESMELAHERTLAGVFGNRRVIKDRLGHIVEDVRAIRQPQDGKDLVLSIDSKIQHIAYTQLKKAVEMHKAKAAGLVVLDVQTGEVLALVNMPTYNPNDRRTLRGAKLRNRVLTDSFEPGSVMKPFTIALALEKGIVHPKTRIKIGSRLAIGRSSIGDTHHHDVLSVEEIIEKSSNVGTAKIALRMQPREMWEMLTTVGFGQQPKLDFPGAVAGRVRPYSSWRPIEQATMSYGYGLSVSLIQVARAYMIFARNGDIVPLTFLKTSDLPIVQKVISEKTARAVRKMMEMATSNEGTAPQAQVPGYRVAGKTGTAHKIEGGRYVNKYVSSFVGMAPASNPRLIIAVMVDEPSGGKYYGGDVAAPVFSAVAANALRAMNIAPDLFNSKNLTHAEQVKGHAG